MKENQKMKSYLTDAHKAQADKSVENDDQTVRDFIMISYPRLDGNLRRNVTQNDRTGPASSFAHLLFFGQIACQFKEPQMLQSSRCQ